VLAVGPIALSTDLLLMLGFAAFAGAAGLAMLRRHDCAATRAPAPAWAPVAGAGTGALTALFGAGGGFILLPALVLLAGLPFEQAVGASLTLVAAQSVAGALGAVSAMPRFDVQFALALTATMLLGMAWGLAAGGHATPARLRRGFGWLVLIVAAAVTVQQLR
jgi:uncharacterized membrane protein YfcA